MSTIVGPHDAVRAFWQVVSGSWGPPRETRWRQPHLELSGPAAVAADPRVRRTTREDMDLLYPACVAMYTEEVGLSPEIGGGAEPVTVEFDDDAQFVLRELKPRSDAARMLERFAAKKGLVGTIRPLELEIVSEGAGSFKLWVIKDESADASGHRSPRSRR